MKTHELWRGKLPSAGLTALLAAIPVAVSAVVSHKLFTTEYLPYMGSIEGAYIGLSRYILEHPSDLQWFPLWYAGIPFENTYPPLLHFGVAALAWLTGFSPALAHHAASALIYCLSPVSLFFLAYRLSNDRAAAFVAGLFYTLLSPSVFLVPRIAVDMQTIWGPRRLQTAVVYSDTPHHAALLCIPIALLLLDRVIERATAVRFFAAVFAFAAIALTNWIGAFAATLAVIAYVLSRGPGSWSRVGAVTAAVGIAAYAVASPWIPPSNIATIRENAQSLVGWYVLGYEQVIYACVLVTVLAGLTWLLHREHTGIAIRFSILFLVLSAPIPLTSAYADRYIVPQPDRYHLVMEMAIALLAAFLLTPLLRRQRSMVRNAAIAVAFLLALLQIDRRHAYADSIIRPSEVDQTIERQIAQWLDSNLSGKRVFAAGSTRYWLNAFADVPQVGGGFDNGVHNHFVPDVNYSVPFLEADGERAVAWLKAYGVHAVVVGGPASRDAYRDFRDPAKFEGLLPEIWRDGDDVIYAVPQRTDSLARIILPEHVVKQPPINGRDVNPALPYVRGLEDATLPLATIQWDEPHHGVAEGDLHPEHLLSIQISYHPGWEATVNGEPISVQEDGLGFILIEPGCDGPCRIELTYTGGLEMILAKTSRALVLILGLIWLGLEWRRRNRTS